MKKYQADVLGVYRMVDSYNERPVYKQDGGENYIYYRLYLHHYLASLSKDVRLIVNILYFCISSSTSETWFVGTVVGHQYGWLRNSTEDSKNKR